MYISCYNVGKRNLDDDDDDWWVVGVRKSSWNIACTTLLELQTGCFLEEGLVEGEGVDHKLEFQKPVF